MARVEKTVFISYRRKDISWALAVYQYLAGKKYDVFFDYTHIPSGDFEQIIVSNIKARAHFVLILTPTALDRTSHEGDWLRREIETAMDERRNIVPLFFDGFSFGLQNVTEKLTGKLAGIKRYNGLDVPSGYFPEAMDRLSTRYLNTPLNAVIHPVSTQVRKKVKEEKVAANKALREQKEDIQELVKAAKEKPAKRKRPSFKELTAPIFTKWKNVIEGIASWFKKIDTRKLGMGVGVLFVATIGYFGINSLIQNLGNEEVPSPTQTNQPLIEFSITPEKSVPANTATHTITPTPVTPSITPTSKYSIGSTMTGEDDMILLYVSAGDFLMGSEDGDDNEKPVHNVYLDAFWIDETEVTNEMYQKCVRAGACRLMAYGSYDLDLVYSNFPASAGWDDATSYCTWVHRRLPTEAEWEKAASWDEANQIKKLFPWGNEVNCLFANFKGPYTDSNISCLGTRTKVGSYPKGVSPYGAYDMAGNVWEWVSSILKPYPYDATDGRENLSSEGVRIIRGGSYQTLPYDTRTTTRTGCNCGGGTNLGFRCAMNAE